MLIILHKRYFNLKQIKKQTQIGRIKQVDYYFLTTLLLQIDYIINKPLKIGQL